MDRRHETATSRAVRWLRPLRRLVGGRGTDGDASPPVGFWNGHTAWTVGVPSFLFVLAFGLAVLEIGAKSLWYDESVSIAYARAPFADLWSAVVSRDSNGSLYYLLLWPWVQLFGYGEGIVRLPSAVIAAATPPVLYLVGRRLFSTPVAVFAGVLLALQGMFIEYGQEARSYALAMFLAAASSYLVVRAADGRLRVWWVLYTITFAAGIYAHLFVALVGIAHLAWLLLERVPWRSLGIVYGSVVVLSSPMVAFAVQNPGPNWMSSFALDPLVWTFAAFVSGKWLTLAAYGTLVAIALLAAVARRDRALWFALLWLLVPVAVMVGVSFVKPSLVARYLIVSLPALALTLSATTVLLVPRWASYVVAAVVLGLAVSGAVGWYTGQPKSDWRSATAYVATQAEGGDAIVFYPSFVERPFQYYLGRLHLTAPLATDPREAGSVWLVMNYQWTGTTPPTLGALRESLERTHEPRGAIRNFDGVSVWEFARRTGGE